MAATLNYDVKLNASQAERELQKLQGKLSGVNDNFASLRNTIAGLGLASFVASAINTAAALDDIATSSGIALQNVIGFSKAVKDFGGSLEGANTGIARFANFVQTAADGNKKAQDTIFSLGMSLEDLRKTSDEDILRKTIAGLAAMDDKSKALALGMDIFGKSFASVSFTDVNNNLDVYIAKAAKSAEATKNAADAEENFGRALGALQTAVLQAISPLTSLLAALKPEQIQFFADAVIKLGTAFLVLKIVSTIAPLMLSFSAAVLTARGSMVSLLTVLGITAGFNSAKTGAYLLTAAMSGLGNSFRVATGGVRLFFGSLATALTGFVRFIPIVGQVAAVLMILNDAVDMITGKSLVAWADSAAASLAKLFGIEYQTEEQKQKLADTNKQLNTVVEDQAAAVRDVTDALQKEKDALGQIVKAYQMGNEESNKRFRLETASIGLSEKAKLAAEQKFEVESKFNQEMLKLETQLNEKKKSNSESDKKMIPAILTTMADLTDAYQLQKQGVDALVESRIKETQANQLKLFQTQSMIDSEQKLKDLQLSIANTGIPSLIQQYNTLDDAARKSAESAIAAEEARRKEKLSPTEIASYYEAATKGVDKLKESTRALTTAQEAYNLTQFGIKERIQLENDLQKILDSTAKMTMGELQKREYDILQTAKARAKAEIEAAEARRGTSLNASEIKQYYDTAIAGTQALIEAQREEYFTSRKFETGLKTAFATYADEATNAAKIAERVFQKTTQGMEDMIVNFAKTGKFEFKGFVNSILEDLLRSQIRQTMAGILNMTNMGGASASGGFLGNLLGFANGGIIPTNGPVIVGERGPEILSGAAGRQVIPNNQIGGGSVTYNINAVDSMSFKQMVARDPGFIHAIAQQGGRGVPGRR